MEYEKPRCSQQDADGNPCPYEPIHKCKVCGALLCLQHAESFKSPNSGARWRQYDGIYCPTHYEAVVMAHDEQVEQENRMQRVGECMKCGCGFCEEMCKNL